MEKYSLHFFEKTKKQLFIILILITFIQCSSADSKKGKKNIEFGTTRKKTDKEIPLSISINYHIISTKDSAEWLKKLQSGDTLQALLVLNRIDRNSLLRVDSLVVPDTFAMDISIYSPFPKMVTELRRVKKILFVCYYSQSFAAYENGLLIRWGPTSLGKETTPTPTGLFSTNWKAKRTKSTIESTWVMDWYFNLENFQGIAMHQYALPGYPASHACMRLYLEDAKWLYYWADQWVLDKHEISVYGTPVIIFGKYPFDLRKPWLLLPKDNRAIEITSFELKGVAEQYLLKILHRQDKRDSL